MNDALPRPQRLVCVGGIPIDIVVRTEAVPERGGDLRAQAVVDRPGGPFTVLTAAKRLGLPAAYAGGYGEGARGQQVAAALRREGIEILRAAKPGADTGFSLVMVDRDAERTCVSTPGAEALNTRADVESYAPTPGDIVHVTGYDLADPAGVYLVDRLEQWGAEITVAFDPGPMSASEPPALDPTLVTRTLARADVVTVNAREAVALFGSSEPNVVAQLTRGPWTIVRAGAAGAALLHGGQIIAVADVPKVDVLDTTGAGDTHIGAFAAGLHAGLDPAGALQLATDAASLSVREVGPATGPTRTQIDEFKGLAP